MTLATPAPARNNDPWAEDDGFTQIDTRRGPEHFATELGKIAEEEPQFAPTPEEVAAADQSPAPAPLAAEIVSSYDPKVMTLDDGSTVTIERTKDGYKATCALPKGQPEVFEAKTESDLLQAVLVSKLHATKKIREQNHQIKLGRVPAQPARPAQPDPGKKTLSPDELFDYKAQLAANPDLANERWFQLKTGLSLEALVGLAKLGAKAAEELRVEAEAKAFRRLRPEYHMTDENLSALLAYLDKNNLDFVADNLAQAFDELTEAGLLEEAPKAPAPAPPAPQPVIPSAAPVAPAVEEGTETANERIVRVVRRPRASFGLKASNTTVVPTAPTDTRGPSAEELDNLSDTEVDQLFSGIRREFAQSARR